MRSKKEFFADMCEKSKARMKELREADEKLKDIEKKRERREYGRDFRKIRTTCTSSIGRF